MNGRTNSTPVETENLEIPLEPPTNLTATPGDSQVTLTYIDPIDKYATPLGEIADADNQLISKWNKTIIVRKIDSYPQSISDGTIVLESTIRNQYQSSGFLNTNLQNNITHYYSAFAINDHDIPSQPATISAYPEQGTPLSLIADGTIIKIMENGIPTEFYIVAHDYESELNGTGRIAVLRKDGYDQYDMTSYSSSGGMLIPIYGNMNDNCPIIRALNTAYYNLFSSKVKAAIGSTTVTCHHNTNNYLSNSTRHIHIPSITEYKLTDSGLGYYPDIGTPWVIGDSIRICYANGIAVEHWTRTINGSYCSYVDASGRGDWTYGTTSKYARPLFTLPETARVDINMELIEDLL